MKKEKERKNQNGREAKKKLYRKENHVRIYSVNKKKGGKRNKCLVLNSYSFILCNPDHPKQNLLHNQS